LCSKIYAKKPERNHQIKQQGQATVLALVVLQRNRDLDLRFSNSDDYNRLAVFGGSNSGIGSLSVVEYIYRPR
jgi:hypothetical protein